MYLNAVEAPFEWSLASLQTLSVSVLLSRVTVKHLNSSSMSAGVVL